MRVAPHMRLENLESAAAGLQFQSYELPFCFHIFRFLLLLCASVFQKQIFTHVTCATDSDQMKFVFDACKEIILQENLRSNGFMY
jgi:hypothetical protein